MKKPASVFVPIILGLTILMAFSPTAAATSSSVKVKIIGHEALKINQRISATFRFSPGTIKVVSGGTVTFENLISGEAHTVSVVDPTVLPTNSDMVFTCGSPPNPPTPAGPCFQFLVGHFPQGPVPPAPVGSVVTVIDVGAPGFDAPGDSIALLPGHTQDITISAPSGTTLHYMCAIHAWMQGTIDVK